MEMVLNYQGSIQQRAILPVIDGHDVSGPGSVWYWKDTATFTIGVPSTY